MTPLQCTDFRGVGASGGTLAPFHAVSLCGDSTAKRKRFALARVPPDVARQQTAHLKSSITQRWLSWEVTSARTPWNQLAGPAPNSACLRRGLASKAGLGTCPSVHTHTRAGVSPRLLHVPWPWRLRSGDCSPLNTRAPAASLHTSWQPPPPSKAGIGNQSRKLQLGLRNPLPHSTSGPGRLTRLK